MIKIEEEDYDDDIVDDAGEEDDLIVTNSHSESTERGREVSSSPSSYCLNILEPICESHECDHDHDDYNEDDDDNDYDFIQM